MTNQKHKKTHKIFSTYKNQIFINENKSFSLLPRLLTPKKDKFYLILIWFGLKILNIYRLENHIQICSV